MADVAITYKGSIIAELNATGSKTLKTAGCYCEGHIDISYAPRLRTYELTLSKASGWVVLTDLDSDVLEHLNDEDLIVSLVTLNPYEYTFYAGNYYLALNKIVGNYNGTPLYGVSNRMQSETLTASGAIYMPANNTSSAIDGVGGFGMFRLSSNGKTYYLRPGDGFISAGTYRLTFTW